MPAMQLKQRGLAGAVGADEPDQFALLDEKGDIVVGLEAAERLDQMVHFQEGHQLLLLRRIFSTMPQRPRGSKAEMIMMMTP